MLRRVKMAAQVITREDRVLNPWCPCPVPGVASVSAWGLSSPSGSATQGPQAHRQRKGGLRFKSAVQTETVA